MVVYEVAGERITGSSEKTQALLNIPYSFMDHQVPEYNSSEQFNSLKQWSV